MCVSMSWLLALARMILLNTAKRRSMVITTKFRHHKLVASQVFPSLEMSGEQSNSRINWAISCWAAYACNGTPSVRIYNIQRGPYLAGVILLIYCFKCQALILGSGFYFLYLRIVSPDLRWMPVRSHLGISRYRLNTAIPSRLAPTIGYLHDHGVLSLELP